MSESASPKASRFSAIVTKLKSLKRAPLIVGAVVILLVGIGVAQRNGGQGDTGSSANVVIDSLDAANLAIATDPNNSQAWYVRGVFLQTEAGNLEGAVESYTRALEVSPELLSALFNRGLAYKGLKRLDAAKADFAKIVDLKGGVAPLSLVNLGLIEIDQGNQELGERYLQRAYDQDPTLRP